MGELAYERYLASYLKQNENRFLVFSHSDDCDVINEDKLVEVITEFQTNIQKF